MVTVVAVTALWWPRTEVTYRNTAPSAVVYADKSEHFLGIVHKHTLSGRHEYLLVVGRDPGFSYGHLVHIDPVLATEGIESTTWTESGVRLRFRTGHELFVPARSFLFGR
ncbi:hypothetical protein ACFY7C_01115 [Streptomyces sp. NPDC012769]|uniref:hypothetical protein n=1 Tax=Streptomyces sp. NPDC012769 TaxID=3364848 RepID=UPI0036A6F9C1